jgi:endoglucanase
MNHSLLRRLTEAHGVPGQEDAVRSIVVEELKGLGDLSVDAMGNLICHIPGDGPKVMIAAHMDEIGFVVKHIEKDGFLRIHPLGGWDPRQMFSQRVIVQTETGPLAGLLVFGTKPKHMLTDAEASKKPEVDGFFVDLGLSHEEVSKKVRKGDQVTMDGRYNQIGGLASCKAMDDRAGLYVMIEAVRAMRNHKCDIYAVATVQEEIGLRGAAASGSSVQPDVVIALDITLANDIPGISEVDQVTKLGEGAAIKFLDSSLICHPKLFKHFVSIAENHGIKHQIEVLPFGGTDAGAIQRLNGGKPSITLSIPTRYVHTVNETVHPDDMDACVQLLARYLEEAHEGDYSYKV